MKPDIWGKYLWISIHFIAMEYPHTPTNEDKRNYRVFFEQLRNVIPCVTCANNYADHLIKFPLNDTVLDNRLNLFRWTVDMHNEVNKITHTDTISYDDATKVFTDSLVQHNDQIASLLKSHAHITSPSSSHSHKNTSSKGFIMWSFSIFMISVLILITFMKFFMHSRPFARKN